MTIFQDGDQWLSGRQTWSCWCKLTFVPEFFYKKHSQPLSHLIPWTALWEEPGAMSPSQMISLISQMRKPRLRGSDEPRGWISVKLQSHSPPSFLANPQFSSAQNSLHKCKFERQAQIMFSWTSFHLGEKYWYFSLFSTWPWGCLIKSLFQKWVGGLTCMGCPCKWINGATSPFFFTQRIPYGRLAPLARSSGCFQLLRLSEPRHAVLCSWSQLRLYVTQAGT